MCITNLKLRHMNLGMSVRFDQLHYWLLYSPWRDPLHGLYSNRGRLLGLFKGKQIQMTVTMVSNLVMLRSNLLWSISTTTKINI